ncbi:MAG: ComEA family DNA-binding protein [Halieaceae bacterium]
MFKQLFLITLLALTPALASLNAQADEVALAAQAQTVNINAADATTLASQLKGVGKSRAEAIVRYRDTYGPFFSVEDLAEVKGIGRSVIDKNRERITLE